MISSLSPFLTFFNFFAISCAPQFFYETIEGSGPGCADMADIGGNGATDVDDECDTDVENDDEDAIEPGPMEQMLLLLLVQGAIEPRPIIPSGGAMGW